MGDKGSAREFKLPAQRLGQPVSQDDARALFAATAMLMAEGREKGLHYFALHLRVAMMELEPFLGDEMPLLAPALSRPKRQHLRLGDEIKRFIAGLQTDHHA
jgi:hypothetical protein